MNMIQNYRMSYFIISHFNTYMFYQIKRTALLEFIPLIDVSISIGTVASQVFLSDQLCPVAVILHVLKACHISYMHYFCILNLAFDDDTHTNQNEDEGVVFERKASNLDAKRKEEVN